ncbi:MAG: HAMP domain-containing sensor histidine kinase [Pseudomonadota bacterium]|nr:HAMP domain-containing sensor histidine kinase [Pseudomonadota bacterium]
MTPPISAQEPSDTLHHVDDGRAASLAGALDVDPVEVDAILIDSVLDTLRGLQWPSLLVAVIFALLLWHIQPGPWPVLWGAVTVGLEFVWMAVLSHHQRHARHRGAAQRSALARRLGWLWAANGAVWGSSVLMFGSSPLSMPVMLCWLIVVSLGALSIVALAPHHRGLMSYVNSFAGVLVLSYVLSLVWIEQTMLLDGALLLLLLVYWLVLVIIGRGQHEVFLRATTLQHRNGLLIQSLSTRTQALQEALEARRRFLAVATHDIRQPVHALRLYAEMLAQAPDQVDMLAPRIAQSSAAVNNLFDNLFDLARLDWSRLRPTPELVRLRELMADMELRTSPAALDKGLRLRMRVSRRLADVAVVIDRVMVQRIVSNLVLNAIKYTHNGGVLLALRGTPRRPRLEVWDTGVGIPLHEQSLVFREFFKSGQHAGSHDGFGLGLAIVRQLARQIGCTVTLRSRPGQGSVFRVELPEQPDASD